MRYTALQVKTSYSILNSLNNIEKLVTSAVKYGYKSLAITDEDNMFGVMEFYNTCLKYKIKPIIGIELSFEEQKFLLYAKNIKGYKNLIKLSTIVSSNELTKKDLLEYCDNLILIMPFSYYNEEIYGIYSDKYIGYTTISEKEQIIDKKVYINNVSYLLKEDYKYLDYAKMILEGKVLGEYELNRHINRHLLTESEVNEIVSVEEFATYEEIVSKCNLVIEPAKDILPIYDKSVNSKEFLANLAHKGLSKRLQGHILKEYEERLNHELTTIDNMGFNDYFLIVYDYVLYAKKHNILVGPGRGSAAGSLVSYSLGITDIDPIKYNLLFERFLNPERVTMPDIDIDFDALKRNEVIEYVTSKYGNKKVAGIITFNTLGAKQVIRDTGRVLKINPKLIDSVAKMCPSDLKTSYQTNPNLKKLVDNSSDLLKLYQIATHLEGLPRHISVHAAGIVLANTDIDEIIPLYQNQLGMYVTAFTKDYLEPLGLLKMDFLGISNLTMLDEVISSIRDNEKLNITFANIPEEDKKTINLFSDGDTDGIFQFESPGMKRFLKKLKPTSFSDIVSAISLYRPGPMDSIDDYIKRRNGKITIDYLHEDLEPVLKETYGIIVYQEQIMQIARIIAGYSLGEADLLRRAMSKKKADILLKEKERFITQSIKRGYQRETTEKIYDLILKFANYGFNKSHAVAYAMISYKMAFLKTHFYPYFMVSLLNSSINNETKTSTYIAMLRTKGISVKLPDIFISTDKYIVINHEIICPLSIIHNVGSSITRLILNERNNGPFTDFISFVKRCYSQTLNKKVINSLILSNVFNNFGYNKQTLINNLDNIINYVELVGEDTLMKVEEPIIETYPEYEKEILIKDEFNSYGFYLTNHPVTRYKTKEIINSLDIEDHLGKYIYLVLEINSIKEIFTKNNDVMAFVKASDEYCQVELTFFPKIYKTNQFLKVYDIIKVYGRVDKRFDNYQIVVSNVIKLN